MSQYPFVKLYLTSRGLDFALVGHRTGSTEEDMVEVCCRVGRVGLRRNRVAWSSAEREEHSKFV